VAKRDNTVQMYEDKYYLDKFARHECCHCALVHDVEYEVERGRIFTRWKVNAKETAKQRRRYKIKVTRAEP
jgi:hypothetical protein